MKLRCKAGREAQLLLVARAQGSLTLGPEGGWLDADFRQLGEGHRA